MLDQTLNTPLHSQVNILNKNKNGAPQNEERLQAPWYLFSAKFKATANKLRQGKTLLGWCKDILLTGNCHKICSNNSIKKTSGKNNGKFKMKCKIMLKWQYMYKIVNLLGTGEK